MLREVEALKRQHDVHLIHLDWQRGRPLKSPTGMRYTRLPLNRASPLSYHRARRTVAKLARDADVVHTHALTGLIPWLFGRPGSRRQPWVHSEHWSAITAPETLVPVERVALRVLKRLLRRPDAVVAESTRLAEGIRRAGRPHVEIVPCVVPPARVVEPTAAAAVRLVGVGSLIPRKGPLVALDALGELVARGVNAYLTWVGAGPQHDEMLSTARQLGLEDRLTMTGGLDERGVSEQLEAATMFVLPTEGDNFCVVAAEALVHGRPIVSGYRTGAVDYADARVSRFVRDQTGAAYAAAIDNLRAECCLSAQEIAATVSNRFTAATVCEQLTAIYLDARTRVGRQR